MWGHVATTWALFRHDLTGQQLLPLAMKYPVRRLRHRCEHHLLQVKALAQYVSPQKREEQALGKEQNLHNRFVRVHHRVEDHQ